MQISYKLITMVLFFSYIFFNHTDLLAQGEKLYLSGRVYNKITKNPIDLASVTIVQEKTRVQTKTDGSYRISVPRPGIYNIIVRYAGYKQLRSRVAITGDTVRNFFLTQTSFESGVTVKGERDVQNISRRSMTVEEIKEVPASFGDSLNALTSLPGIVRTVGGFFGPLVIRGMYPDRNRYYIDGMPVTNPMHFGGFHSVISNDLMSEIDLYSSSFPVKFGGPLAAVIDINTLDKVLDLGGFADISAISANMILKFPLLKTTLTDGKEEERSAGYVMAAARYGYIALFVPLFYELVFGEKLESAPEYWDYQFKFKYMFDSKNSLTVLLMGSKDFFKFLTPTFGPSMDPFFSNVQLESDQMFHNQGIYYNYHNNEFKNTLMLYSSITTYHSYINMSNVNAPAALKNYSVNSTPYMLGLKNNFSWEWWKGKAELRGNFEATLYYFKAEGKTIYSNQMTGIPDISGGLKFVDLDVNFFNSTVGGYIDNKFTFGGFTIIPGVRADYVIYSNQFTIDPRMSMSYEFETKTTIAAAGGMYSSFYQVNPFVFNDNSDIVKLGSWVKPERAVHAALSLQQKVSYFLFSLEGFYNYYYDLFRNYPHFEDGEFRQGQSTGEVQAYGLEFMIKKDRAESQNDYFGWVSYTWTQVRERSGITGNKISSSDVYDPNALNWMPSGYEMEHALKIVFGYKYNSHTFSARYQLYTSFPYTPIIDGKLSPNPTPPGFSDRYVPVYSTAVNSAHSDIDHRLDIRYSHRTTYSWGYVNWYIEIINIYGFLVNRNTGERWKYNQPYSPGVNPTPSYSIGTRNLSVIPNFGVEVKF
jgi:hypothetical protein